MGTEHKGLLLAVLALMLALVPASVFADLPDPDTIEIESVLVSRHMQQANDTVCLLRYNIDYGNTTQPNEPVDQAFVFTWVDSTGNTTLGNTTAVPFHNLGYGKGCVSFYMDSDYGAYWGDLGNITVQGTALFDAPAPSDTYTLLSGDYSAYTSPADIREELRQYVIANAMFLELNWNEFWMSTGAEGRQIDLLAFISPQYTVLSGTGEGYFTQVVASLRTMCPLLFAVQIINPAYTDQEFDQGLAESYADTYAGTEIENFQEGSSEFFGNIGFQTVGTMITIALVLITMGFCAWKWQRATPGIVIAFPAVLVLTRMGFPDMIIVIASVGFAVLLLAFTLFFKPGAG